MNNNMRSSAEIPIATITLEELKKEEQITLDGKVQTIESLVSSMYKTAENAEYHRKQILLKNANEYKNTIDNPYFGRFDILEDGVPKAYYIGEVGITKDDIHLIVVHHHSKIARVFYAFSGGKRKVSYTNEWGETIEVEVLQKRNIDIMKRKVIKVNQVKSANAPVPLLGSKITGNSLPSQRNNRESDPGSIDQNDKSKHLSDSDLPFVDEYLLDILSRRHDNFALHDLIRTLQAEQDDIIRLGLTPPILVQGTAGSGKSSIALHRISYLLYEYRETLKPEDVLIIAPNVMFLDYIKGTLPKLKIDQIKQATFLSWAQQQLKGIVNHIEAPFVSLANIINNRLDVKDHTNHIRFKGSVEFKEIIDEYMKNQENQVLPRHSLKVGRYGELKQEEVENVFKGKKYAPLNQRIKETIEFIKDWSKRKREEEIDTVKRQFDTFSDGWITLLPQGSTERRNLYVTMEQLRDQKIKNIQSAFLSETDRYVKHFKLLYPLNLYLLVFSLASQSQELSNLATWSNSIYSKTLSIGYEDAAPLIYINKLLNGYTETYKYTIIDEAQDLSPLEVILLKEVSQSMTLLGDITQSLYYFKGLDSWDKLQPDVFETTAIKKISINVSYRSTYEIMMLANRVIQNSGFDWPSIVPVHRHGPVPQIKEVVDGDELFDHILEVIKDFRRREFKNIAIIGKDVEQTKAIYEELIEAGEEQVQHIVAGDERLEGQIIVIPSYLVKGLEFDAVLLPNVSEQRFSSNDPLDARLLFVSLTRAHHELHAFYHGPLTKLLQPRE